MSLYYWSIKNHLLRVVISRVNITHFQINIVIYKYVYLKLVYCDAFHTNEKQRFDEAEPHSKMITRYYNISSLYIRDTSAHSLIQSTFLFLTLSKNNLYNWKYQPAMIISLSYMPI